MKKDRYAECNDYIHHPFLFGEVVGTLFYTSSKDHAEFYQLSIGRKKSIAWKSRNISSLWRIFFRVA